MEVSVVAGPSVQRTPLASAKLGCGHTPMPTRRRLSIYNKGFTSPLLLRPRQTDQLNPPGLPSSSKAHWGTPDRSAFQTATPLCSSLPSAFQARARHHVRRHACSRSSAGKSHLTSAHTPHWPHKGGQNISSSRGSRKRKRCSRGQG